MCLNFTGILFLHNLEPDFQVPSSLQPTHQICQIEILIILVDAIVAYATSTIVIMTL
jgi:hypothetical protein